MGRTPLSGLPLLWRLRRSGVAAQAFGYATFFEDFAHIEQRLAARIGSLAKRGDYVLIGHSLGGVLIRAAMRSTRAPSRAPLRIFLLGSPIGPARMARAFERNPLYRLLAGDCGQLLGSSARMAAIGPCRAPATAVVGVRGLPLRTPFGDEPNDGLVSVSEVSAEWLDDRVEVPVIHGLLPASAAVASVILRRLDGM